MSSNNKLDSSGLGKVWEKVFSLVKVLTGDVDVAGKGNLQEQINEAASIAKGRNQARVFSTTADMQAWLANKANKGICNVGDNLYIIDVGVPDWWVAEVLDTADSSTGYYYKIAQLEVQKVDLSEYLKITGDTKNNVATFTSGDSTSSTGWTNVSALTSGLSHANIFNRISTMFKNVRWLYKMLGTADISALSANGTVTDALVGLNTNVFKFQYALNAAANFDELLESGIYPTNMWTGTGGTSLPPVSTSDIMGMTVVMTNSAGTSTAQFYIGYGGAIWYRGINESTWSEWKCITTFVHTSNLDTVKESIEFIKTSVNPVGFPAGLGGNGCNVLQSGADKYRAQLAFGFGSDKMAIRRKYGSYDWTEWKYVNFIGDDLSTLEIGTFTQEANGPEVLHTQLVRNKVTGLCEVTGMIIYPASGLGTVAYKCGTCSFKPRLNISALQPVSDDYNWANSWVMTTMNKDNAAAVQLRSDGSLYVHQNSGGRLMYVPFHFTFYSA